ncbi:MAG TPA: zinc ribbon domain-containing protein [Steroidobacteraceae bacterium]
MQSIYMKAFCTSCGAEINPDTAFCTGCGARAGTLAKPLPRNRKWPWIVALILLFALGFWLGHMMAPKCPACPAPHDAGSGGRGGGGGGGGGQPGVGGGGKGDPSKGGGSDADGTGRVVGAGGRTNGAGGAGGGGNGSGSGDMSGDGHGSANGTTVGRGRDGSAVGASGSDDGGAGLSGSSTIAGGPNGAVTDPDARKSTQAGVWRLAAGAPLTLGGTDAPMDQGKDATIKVLSAPDFSYDKTGLPRYPDSNTAIFSAISYDQPDRIDAYRSSAGIVTGSTFDDVTTWYRKNLPSGWSATTIGDLNRVGAVAQALSPDKLMQMLAASSGTTPAKSVGDLPATATAQRLRLSMFKPPQGSQGDLGVLIVQRGDEPVTVMMKTHISPNLQ